MGVWSEDIVVSAGVRPVVLVDMDGVLADFERAFYKHWAARYPERRLPAPEDRQHSQIIDDLPEPWHRDARLITHAPGFFRDLPALSGALDGVRGLSALYDTWICSTPLREGSSSLSEKLEWVEHHLGAEWTERLILTRAKYMIDGDILIDDTPHLEGLERARWQLVVFDAPANLSVTSFPHMNWKNWREVIPAILSRIRPAR